MQFNPSLYFGFLTPFYDWLFRILLPRKKIRDNSVKLLDSTNSATIAELGSGTGDLTLQLALNFPQSSISAIDLDTKANAILNKKISKTSISNIKIIVASSDSIPFGDGTLSAIFASLLFCNLPLELKHQTLKEVRRVLKDDGKLLITEWGPPQSILAKTGFIVLQTIGKSNIKDLKQGMLPFYLKENGFSVQQKDAVNTLFGTIYFYEAGKLKS